MMRMARAKGIVVLFWAGASALAQPEPIPRLGDASAVSTQHPGAADSSPTDTGWKLPEEGVSAVEAVRRGNQLLKSGEAPNALKWYDRAAELEPDAPQIPFVKGLGYYASGDYEAARRQFESAAASSNGDIALDALYSIGTTYHAEALSNPSDGKVAVEKLEEAMRRYRSVLKDRPTFAPALDADRKAAQLRRMIREQLEQQPPQSSESADQEDSEESESSPSETESSPSQGQDPKEKPDGQEQESSGQSQDSQAKDQSRESPEGSSESQAEESSPEQSAPEDSEESSESASQAGEAQESESNASQSKEASSKAETSQGDEGEDGSDVRRKEEAAREQAERRLREMMQAQRERQERRRLAPPPPVRPVEKDW